MTHERSAPARRAPALLFVALIAAWTAGCGTLTREFEYEEDITLSLDGRAVIYVNASLAALAALRGADVNLRPDARFDADRIRAFFTSPVTRVGRISSYRRHGRRYASVRVDVDDIRQAASARPFAWSTYALDRTASEVVYRQAVGAAADRDVGDVGWAGRERVAFRLHLPSKITFHNAPSKRIERGNILEWDQSLTDRRSGVPIAIEVHMEPTSILYRTLWLFAISGLAALLALAVIIWWVVKRA
jgi:hypothetical protein